MCTVQIMFHVMLLSGACAGITAVGVPFTGHSSPDYILIEEVLLNPDPTSDIIPHAQETVFNTQQFYGSAVSGNDIVAYRYTKLHI